MANPVTYRPLLETFNNVTGTGSFYINRLQRSKQAKPYNIATNYNLRKVVTTRASTFGGAAMPAAANALAYMGNKNQNVDIDFGDSYSLEREIAENGFRAKLSSKILAASAELGITFTQRQQTIDMITTRGRQLLRFFSDLKAGRVKRARRTAIAFDWLKPGPKPRKRKKKTPPPASMDGLNRDSANLLLETQFGWIPTIESVYNACQVLSNPINTNRILCRGPIVKIDNSYYKAGALGSYQSSETIGRVVTFGGATAWIENPDLYLANRMGLINPAAVFWDAVPFSFIVNWFVSIGQFLNSLTDFFGVGLRNPFYSTRYRVAGAFHDFSYYLGLPRGYDFYKTGVRLQRNLGIPSVKLIIRPFHLNLFHVQTTWALVVQRIPR